MSAQTEVNNSKNNLVYPELSYQIIGCAFDVFNELGYGYAEKEYQKAMAISLRNRGLSFREQAYYPVKFQNEILRKGFCDFVVDDKVIIELKKNDRFARTHIERVNQYLKSSNLKLALLINFSAKGVIFKRLVNIR